MIARAGGIGASVRRLEDPPLLTGRGAFADDISFPGQLHMRMVRSAEAHGRLVSVDTEAACALPGVHAVWTAADVSDIPAIEFREGPIEKIAAWRQHVLARDRVRYVGEPIAAIFADDPYIAEDAAALVVVEIVPLPVVLNAAGPTGEFAPGLSTEPTLSEQGFGDVPAAFEQAHTVVELDLQIGRLMAVVELFARVVPNRLQHLVARAMWRLDLHDQRLFDQGGQQVEDAVGAERLVAADRLGRRHVEAAPERCQSIEQGFFIVLQHVVGPVDQGAQGLLALLQHA